MENPDLKISRCSCLGAIVFLGGTLLCAVAAIKNQTADWTELRGADSRTVRTLLQHRVDLKRRDADGNSALHVAVLHAVAEEKCALLNALDRAQTETAAIRF
jgi:ankyrin repeat protein